MTNQTEDVRQELIDKLAEPGLTDAEIAKIEKKLKVLKDNS